MSVNQDRYATLTRELAEISARIICEQLSVPDDRAEAVGLKIAVEVCDELRGQLVYIPANRLAKIDQRDRDMLSTYIASGRSIHAVMEKFDVCMQTAYKRVRLAEAAAYALRQGALFPEGEP